MYKVGALCSRTLMWIADVGAKLVVCLPASGTCLYPECMVYSPPEDQEQGLKKHRCSNECSEGLSLTSHYIGHAKTNTCG